MDSLSIKKIIGLINNETFWVLSASLNRALHGVQVYLASVRVQQVMES